jgi:hypothetical protein
LELFDELVVSVTDDAVKHGVKDFVEGGSVLKRKGNSLVLFMGFGRD